MTPADMRVTTVILLFACMFPAHAGSASALAETENKAVDKDDSVVQKKKIRQEGRARPERAKLRELTPLERKITEDVMKSGNDKWILALIGFIVSHGILYLLYAMRRREQENSSPQVIGGPAYYAEVFRVSGAKIEDAAIKFCLERILSDHRLDSLANLMDGSIGGVAGDPGWILERRNEHDVEWPADARFKAFVDPEEFWLDRPEFFMDKKTFYQYVSAGVDEYMKLNPERRGEAESVLVILQAG
jgi:hypothetical protein